MILDQLRREILLRRLPWFVPVGLLLGAGIWALCRQAGGPIDAVPYVDHPSGLYPTLVIVWSWLMAMMLNAGINVRCSGPLDLALPLPGRRLWLVHCLAIVISGWALLAIIATVVAAGNLAAGQRPLLEPGLVSLAIHLAVALAFTLAVVQSPKPVLYEIPLRPTYVALILCAIAGFLGLTILLSTLPRPYAVVPLTLALLLGVRTYRALPVTLRLAPDAAEPDRGATVPAAGDEDAQEVGAVRARGRLARAWLVNLTIWRASPGNWAWVFPVILAFHGFVLAKDRLSAQRLAYLFFTVVVLSTWLVVSLKRLHALDALPISRNRVFGVIMLPALLSVVAGYAVTTGSDRILNGSQHRVDYRMERCCPRIHVPHDRWKIVRAGRVPAIRTPWGESLQLRRRPLIKSGRLAVYDPYGTATDSSPDFVAFQLSRAIAEVYGRTIPYQEIRDRYLETDDQGRVRSGPRGFALLEDYPELRTRGGGRVLPAVLLLVALPWMLIATLAFRMHRGDRNERTMGFVFGGIFAVLLLCGIAVLLGEVLGWLDPSAVSRMGEILLGRLADRLPGGTAAIWAIASMVLSAGYLLARQQFRTVEAAVACAERPR